MIEHGIKTGVPIVPRHFKNNLENFHVHFFVKFAHMAQQVELFEKMFCNGLPTSNKLLQRSKMLFSKTTFDDSCVEFHNAFLKYGLDFAFCWCSVRSGGETSAAKRLYTEIVERTNIEYLYDVEDYSPSTPFASRHLP